MNNSTFAPTIAPTFLEKTGEAQLNLKTIVAVGLPLIIPMVTYYLCHKKDLRPFHNALLHALTFLIAALTVPYVASELSSSLGDGTGNANLCLSAIGTSGFLVMLGCGILGLSKCLPSAWKEPQSSALSQSLLAASYGVFSGTRQRSPVDLVEDGVHSKL